jgi:type II restriction enzyme
VVHFVEKNWLVLIEATTSHGPINPKRRNELKAIFGNSTAGLVFVTAFDRRSDMARYIQDLRKIMEKRTTKDTKDTKLRRFQRVLA